MDDTIQKSPAGQVPGIHMGQYFGATDGQVMMVGEWTSGGVKWGGRTVRRKLFGGGKTHMKRIR